MDEDVLELTQMVRDDGSVVKVDEEPDDWPPPRPEPPRRPEPPPVFDLAEEDEPFDPPPRPVPPPAPPSIFDDDDLVSAPTARAASAAFAQLASSIGPSRGPGVYIHSGGPTLEDIVKDLLRPLLREWLDDNLPPLVEQLVRREIEKMVRRAHGG
jgi:uncharacterized protein